MRLIEERTHEHNAEGYHLHPALERWTHGRILHENTQRCLQVFYKLLQARQQDQQDPKTQKIRRPGRGVLTSPCRAPKTQTAGWCGGLMWQEAQSCNKVSDL